MPDNDVVFPTPVPTPSASSPTVDAIRRAISAVNSIGRAIVHLTPGSVDDSVFGVIAELDTSDWFAHLVGGLMNLPPEEREKLVASFHNPSS